MQNKCKTHTHLHSACRFRNKSAVAVNCLRWALLLKLIEDPVLTMMPRLGNIPHRPELTQYMVARMCRCTHTMPARLASVYSMSRKPILSYNIRYWKLCKDISQQLHRTVRIQILIPTKFTQHQRHTVVARFATRIQHTPCRFHFLPLGGRACWVQKLR